MREDMARGSTKLFLILALLSMTHAAPIARDNKTSPSWSLELEEKMYTLNKRPIKSIESSSGDIIDCVNIYEQPAFDHPLFKDHKIQMKPSNFPKGSFSSNNESNKIPGLWHLNERCPKGTIPIRRTKITDLLRAESIETFGMKKKLAARNSNANSLAQGHEYAITYLDDKSGEHEYYGAKATMNVWKSYVQDQQEFSGANIVLVGGPLDQDFDSVEAGWEVNPTLYGDRKPRLFIHWTRDGYKSTGCYNLLCPGFVQVDRSSLIGVELRPVSKYGDRTHQYDIVLTIFKDNKTDNWWLLYGQDKSKVIGYWPSSLFTYLDFGATTIQWGGEVINSKAGGKHTTTEMGSGHFSEEGLGKASFFRNVKYVDEANNLVDPVGWLAYTSKQTSNCYDIKTFEKAGNYEYGFFYGGPGRNEKCP